MRIWFVMLTAILKFAGLAIAERALQRTYDAVVDRLRCNKLSNDLADAIREWASRLLEYCVPDTLITILFAPPIGEVGPLGRRLRKNLEEMRLPSIDVWFASGGVRSESLVLTFSHSSQLNLRSRRERFAISRVGSNASREPMRRSSK